MTDDRDDAATQALRPQPVGLPGPVDESLEASPLDALFGEAAFVVYEEAPIIPPPRRQRAAGPGQELVAVPMPPRRPRAPITRVQKVLMGVAGGLVAALALIALFVLGTRLSSAFPPAVAASVSPSPSPGGGPLAVGPVAPGPHAWDELLGGECVDPFENAWQDKYVVVDCTGPHAAQHVFRGMLDEPSGTVYAGVDELQSRIAALCTSPTVIDFAAAGTVPDLQLTASLPMDAAQWDGGDRDYFCFVDRAGGEPLTGSLVVPAAPAR